MTIRDHELLEQFRGEPELIAVADALADALRVQSAPARPRRRRIGAAVLGAAAAAAAVAAAILLLTQGDRGFADRALAAIGDAPVLHVVTSQTSSSDSTLVEIATGRRIPQTRVDQNEIWFDPARGIEHTLTRTNGELASDVLQTPSGTTSNDGPVWTCASIARHPVEATRDHVSCNLSGDNGTTPRNVPEPPPTLDPALAGFVNGYRDALASGAARRVGEGTVDGRPVYWLEFRPEENQREQVAVDRDTYKPILVRTSIGGRSWYEYRVLEIGSVDRDAADFSKPRIEHRALSTGVAGEDPIDLQQARTLLGRAAFWAGKEVAGRKLALVRRQEVRVGFGRDSGVPPRTGVALELVYGQVQNGHGSGDFVAISEATDPEYVWAWPQTPWERQVPEGSLRFNLFGAFLQRDGVYVQILHFPPSEEVALAVARALRPIGSG